MHWSGWKSCAIVAAAVAALGAATFPRLIANGPGSNGAAATGATAAEAGATAAMQKAPPATRLERPTNPDKAFQWQRLRWLDENGQIPPLALQTALEQRQANIEYWETQAGPARNLDSLDWSSHGPSNVGGRSRSLLIHPNDPSKLWIGSVSGGIWRSTNAGASWALVNDFLPTLAIGCMAFDPVDPNIMYAGTGEGYFNGDAVGGLGLYKSTDGGLNWSVIPTTAGWDNVCRIAISPTNRNFILVAKRYGGILRSVNGGSSWTTVYGAQGGFCVAWHPTDGTKAVAAVIDYDFGSGNWFHRALYSNNSGQNWNAAASGLTQVWDFGSRIELAYAKSTPTTVYASCARDGGKIWRSTDGGVNYVQRTGANTSGANWYASPLWVNPVDPNFLLTGGYHIFKSTDGGATLTQISDGYIMTTQPHPDIHFFTNEPGYNNTTNRRVYVCNDGGAFRTDNILTASTGSGWSDLNPSYRTTQFYGAAGHGPNGRIIGGTQDNGTLRVTTSSSTANLPFGGDGGFCAIDSQDPNYTYGEYITLQIHRSTNGGVSAGYIYSGIADAGTNANFIAPFILDENAPRTMLAGGRSLWRTTDARRTLSSVVWTEIKPAGNDNISAIAVARGASNKVWVGLNNGEVYRTNNGTAGTPTWITVDDNGATNPLPNRYVTRILIDRDDPNVAHVALGGFSPDNLLKTTNSGASWIDLTGSGATGLPDAPIYGIARHPNSAQWLYVSTEVGIFQSLDGGQHWSTTNRGPANARTDELVFMNSSTRLLAATHGRGLWTANVPPPCPGDADDDRNVDQDDLDLVLFNFGTGVDPGTGGDVNGDGVVDQDDLDEVLFNFGAVCA